MGVKQDCVSGLTAQEETFIKNNNLSEPLLGQLDEVKQKACNFNDLILMRKSSCSWKKFGERYGRPR